MARYGCTATGGNWKELDEAMYTISLTASCQALCIQQRVDGCCYLSVLYGCWWKAGADVSNCTDDSAISVRCSASGKVL